MRASFSGVKQVDEVYFIGIGGIGMSALAKFFFESGVKVSGYDKTRTALTVELEKMGMSIHYDEDLSKASKTAKWIIYTPAIPATHKELMYYKEKGYLVMKRSEVLGEITKSSLNICVAGTHGKTTTTTMIAHILRHSGIGCNAFLGGIAANYGTNYWSDANNCCVVEADEYDRSFLKLNPDLGVITSMDADHLDIYGTAEHIENAFLEFASKIKQEGVLVLKYGLKRQADFKLAKLLTYHLDNTQADCYCIQYAVVEGGYLFDIKFFDEIIKEMYLPMGGLHNVENALAAIALAKMMNVSNSSIRMALKEFKGVKRRFELVAKADQLTIIDDYAHHPEELRALITGIRSIYKDHYCTVVFQPHLYSRTNDLADEFASVLEECDQVILLPIYPARELPIPGVSSEMVANKMKLISKKIMLMDQVVDWIETIKNDKKKQVIVIAGAGNIDQLPSKIKEKLNK
jgi:UDP-N-acetylmuramate--alanine ligase